MSKMETNDYSALKIQHGGDTYLRLRDMNGNYVTVSLSEIYNILKQFESSLKK